MRSVAIAFASATSGSRYALIFLLDAIASASFASVRAVAASSAPSARSATLRELLRGRRIQLRPAVLDRVDERGRRRKQLLERLVAFRSLRERFGRSDGARERSGIRCAQRRADTCVKRRDRLRHVGRLRAVHCARELGDKRLNRRIDLLRDLRGRARCEHVDRAAVFRRRDVHLARATIEVTRDGDRGFTAVIARDERKPEQMRSHVEPKVRVVREHGGELRARSGPVDRRRVRASERVDDFGHRHRVTLVRRAPRLRPLPARRIDHCRAILRDVRLSELYRSFERPAKSHGVNIQRARGSRPCHGETRFTPGGAHDPSTIDGALVFGQYIRSVRLNSPLAGAGSQFASRSLPGESC